MPTDAIAVSSSTSINLPATKMPDSSWFANFDYMFVLYIVLGIVALFLLFKLVMYIIRKIKRQKDVNSLQKDLMVRQVLTDLSKGGKESDVARKELNLKLSLIELAFNRGQKLIAQKRHLGTKKSWFIMLGEPACGKTSLLEASDLGLVASGLELAKSKASFGASTKSTTATKEDTANPNPNAEVMSQGTTALGSSNLNAPKLADESSPAIEFYVGHSQVVLDVSGQVFFDHWAGGSSAEYIHICDLIKNQHSDEPLRGILLCIPADALLADDSKLSQKKALLMLEELRRLTSTLEQILPCFILITKLDVILGFREYFESQGEEHKDQALGFLNPYGEIFESEIVEQFFTKFQERLNSGVYALLESKEILDLSYHGKSRLDKSAGIYLFAQNFAKLQNNLLLYLNTIFNQQSNNYAFFRGLFFTSSQDAGYCLNENFAYLAHQSLDNAPYIDLNYKYSRSYFIKEALNSYVFKDAPSNHFTRHALFRRYIPRYVLACICAVLSLYFMYGAFFAAPRLNQILSNETLYYASLDHLFRSREINQAQLIGLNPQSGEGFTLFDMPMPHDSNQTRLAFLLENQSHTQNSFDLPWSLMPGAVFSLNWNIGTDKAAQNFIYNQLQTNMVYLPLVQNIEYSLNTSKQKVTTSARDALFALMSIALYSDLNSLGTKNDSYNPSQAEAMLNYLYPNLTTNIHNRLLYFIPQEDWYSKATNDAIISDAAYVRACQQGIYNLENHWNNLSNYPDSDYQKLKEDLHAAKSMMESYLTLSQNVSKDLSQLSEGELLLINTSNQQMITNILNNAEQLDFLIHLLWLDFQQNQLVADKNQDPKNSGNFLTNITSATSKAKANAPLTTQVPTDFNGGIASAYKTINVSNLGSNNAQDTISHHSYLDQIYADYLGQLKYDFAFFEYFDKTRKNHNASRSSIHFGVVNFDLLAKKLPELEMALADDYAHLKSIYFDMQQNPLFSPGLVVQATQNVTQKATAPNPTQDTTLVKVDESSLQELMHNFKLNYSLFVELLKLCQLPYERKAIYEQLSNVATLEQTFNLFLKSRELLVQRQQQLADFLAKNAQNDFVQSLAPIGQSIINLNQQALIIACYDKIYSFYPEGHNVTTIMSNLSKELGQAPFSLDIKEPIHTFEYEEILGTKLNLRHEYNPGPFIQYLKPLIFINNWLKSHGVDLEHSAPLQADSKAATHSDHENQACEDIFLVYKHIVQNTQMPLLLEAFSSYARGMINYYTNMADNVKPYINTYSSFHALVQNSRAYEINDKLHALYDLSYRAIASLDDNLFDESELQTKKNALEYLNQKLNQFSLKLNDDCAIVLNTWSMLPANALAAGNMIEENPDLSKQLWTSTTNSLPWWQSFEKNGRRLIQSEAIDQGTLTVDTLMTRLNEFPVAKDGDSNQSLSLDELNSLYAAFKFLGLKPENDPLAVLNGNAGQSSSGLDGMSGVNQQFPSLVKSLDIRQQIIKQSSLGASFIKNLDQILETLCAKRQMGFELFVPNAAKQNQLYKSARFSMPLASLTYRYISAKGEGVMQDGAMISSAQAQNRKLYSGLVFDQSLTLSFYEFSSDSKPQAQFSLYNYPALQMYLSPSALYDEKEHKAYIPITITSNKGSFVFFIGLQFDQELPSPSNWPSSADFKTR